MKNMNMETDDKVTERVNKNIGTDLVSRGFFILFEVIFPFYLWITLMSSSK
jgi:hypothetical protein